MFAFPRNLENRNSERITEYYVFLSAGYDGTKVQ